MPTDNLTKKDLLIALSNLRNEITAEIKAEIRAQDIRIDIKLEKMELRIDDRARKYNSDILSRFDSWAGELEKADQDREISTHKINEIRVDVDEHEKRIKRLERAQN